VVEHWALRFRCLSTVRQRALVDAAEGLNQSYRRRRSRTIGQKFRFSRSGERQEFERHFVSPHAHSVAIAASSISPKDRLHPAFRPSLRWRSDCFKIVPARERRVSMCEKYDRLLAVYRRTVRSFSISLDALQAAIAISPKDSQGVQEYVEQVRAISEGARIKLEKHLHEHRCQSENSTP
jgi:hypothetical protein